MSAVRVAAVVSAVLISWPSFAFGIGSNASIEPSEKSFQARLNGMLVAQRRSCKAVSSCQEAVELWCGGYSRADADDDGIPCENVCKSKAQVDVIKAEIGC